MMIDVSLFLSAFAVLFVIIDPPGCAPIFATLTNGTSRKHQKDMAIKSVFVAALILFGFAYAGEFLFENLHISMDALRIAGGIMLFMIGLNMVFEKRTEKREDRAEEFLEEVANPEDISVFPMGIPMIAGPGTMASLLLLKSEAETTTQEITILLALAIVLIVTYISFLIAGPIMRMLGQNFTDVLTRVLGVLLATLAAQFIIDGVQGAFLI